MLCSTGAFVIGLVSDSSVPPWFSWSVSFVLWVCGGIGMALGCSMTLAFALCPPPCTECCAPESRQPLLSVDHAIQRDAELNEETMDGKQTPLRVLQTSIVVEETRQ